MSSSRPSHRSTNRSSSSSHGRSSNRSGPPQAPLHPAPGSFFPGPFRDSHIYVPAPPGVDPYGFPPNSAYFVPPPPTTTVFAGPPPSPFGFHPLASENYPPPGSPPWLSNFTAPRPATGFVENELVDSSSDEDLRRAINQSNQPLRLYLPSDNGPSGSGIPVREPLRDQTPAVQPSAVASSELRQDQRNWLALRTSHAKRDHENFERFAKSTIDRAIDREQHELVFFETLDLNYTKAQLLRTICYMAKKLKEKDPDSSLGYDDSHDRRTTISSSSRAAQSSSQRARDDDDRRSTTSSSARGTERHSHSSSSHSGHHHHRHSSDRTRSRATSPTPSRASTHTSRSGRHSSSSSPPSRASTHTSRSERSSISSTHTSRSERPSPSSSRPLREVVAHAALARQADTGLATSSTDSTRTLLELQDELKDLREKVDGRKCNICLGADADTIFVACRHLAGCFDCAQRWVRHAGNCPVCRGNATEDGIARLFLS